MAQLVSSTATSLETITLARREATPEAAYEFGSRLAVTHAYAPTGRRVFGEQPPTFPDEFDAVGHMGNALLTMVPAGSKARTFGEFYADDRLLPYADGALTEVIEQLAERLHDGVFDSPQPALVTTDAALIHGDLWSGNVIWSPQATLIDPACHGGHAESDLAQLGVFGAPFIDEIYAGYNAISPLADGWEERIGLHQLHILIIHAALFGGGYVAQTIRTARNYI